MNRATNRTNRRNRKTQATGTRMTTPRHSPLTDFQPLSDRVLVRRLPKSETIYTITKPEHVPVLQGPVACEGIVIAVGPGKMADYGDIIPTVVKPGDKVLFNARWNDFAAPEVKGSDCDGNGPLERPLPYDRDPMIHLITESDIAGVLS